jgi:hypothetical protein
MERSLVTTSVGSYNGENFPHSFKSHGAWAMPLTIRNLPARRIKMKVKCIDASNTYDCLEEGAIYEVVEAIQPMGMRLVNTRGKGKGEIAANKETVYHLTGNSPRVSAGRWDVSRFVTVEE